MAGKHDDRKETAQQGVEHVRDDGASAVQGVKETASSSTESGSRSTPSF